MFEILTSLFQQTYIHRSGRTARARQEGLSILLVEPAEISKYRRLCGTLNRATDLPPFPVNVDVMDQVKKRIKLARKIESMEHATRKANAQRDWFRRAAEEAELLLDEYVNFFIRLQKDKKLSKDTFVWRKHKGPKKTFTN